MNFLPDWLLSLLKPRPNLGVPGDENIIAAEVKTVVKHPNADRLVLVGLDIGGKVIEPVVCGAKNFKVGDKVVLALPGARIAQNIHSSGHESFILEKATIRGVESQGMICSAFELGIGPLTEKPEILILKPDSSPGSKFRPDMIQN